MNLAAVGHPVITGNAMINDVIISQFTVTNYAAKPVESMSKGVGAGFIFWRLRPNHKRSRSDRAEPKKDAHRAAITTVY